MIIPKGNSMSIQYDKATYCTKGAATGTKQLAELVKKQFPQIKQTGIFNCRKVRGSADNFSTHAEGRGLDIHTTDKALGDKIRDWLFANRYTFGIQEIIWYRKIWTSNKESQGFRDYKGTNPHTDHIHCAQNRAAAGIKVDANGVIPDAERLVFAGLQNADGSIGLETFTTTQVVVPAVIGSALVTGAAFYYKKKKKKFLP